MVSDKLLEEVAVYSGTTQENYETCAYQQDDVVIFDKSRERAHEDDQLHFYQIFSNAARHSYHLARGTGSYPYILEGKVNQMHLNRGRLPADEQFVVDKVWVLNDGVTLGSKHILGKNRLEAYFHSMNPNELLFE